MNGECGDFLHGLLNIYRIENHLRVVSKSLMARVKELGSLGLETQLY